MTGPAADNAIIYLTFAGPIEAAGKLGGPAIV